MYRRETVSPEATEIERRAEYFELEQRKRMRAVGSSVALIAVMLAGGIVLILMGGCKRNSHVRRLSDGTCVELVYEQVVPVKCPPAEMPQ